MSNDLAVEAAGLEKSYGKVRVLAGVSLNVPRGSIFALLGPNGAGKTTTVRILATLSRPDAGRATVAGYDIVRERHLLRRSISLTGQFAAVDGLQTGEENLPMMARLSGLTGAAARRRARQLLEQFGLADVASRRAGGYSGGMRRRLDLAASLTGQPAVVFLDEPTTGLDLRSRQSMWQVIGELAGRGVTVFLTTQYLEEADRLADRIAVVDDGRVVAEGAPAELKKQVADQRLDLMLASPAFFAGLARKLGARAIHLDPGSLTIGVATDGSAAQVRALLDEIDPGGGAVRRFTVHTATLDDVFLALTGHPATAAEQPPAQAARPAGHPEEEAVHV
jgi:ABC-2 type transport system ATP-binding protein